MDRLQAIGELADFLAVHTILVTVDPGKAGMIAERLYDAGWRRERQPLRGVQIGDGNVQSNTF